MKGSKNRFLEIVMILTELSALALVVFLFLKGKMQIWLLVFAGGAAVSVFAGRIFCGWLCPMNTLFKGIDFIYKKLKIKRLKAPEFLKNNIVRMVFLVLFIAGMLLTKKFNLKLNILLYIISLSIFISLFVEEMLWHRYLCPFGTILSFTSRKAVVFLNIDEKGCISCGKCQRVCPSSSIVTMENKKRKNLKHECLLCRNCIAVCPPSVCNITNKDKTRS